MDVFVSLLVEVVFVVTVIVVMVVVVREVVFTYSTSSHVLRLSGLVLQRRGKLRREDEEEEDRDEDAEAHVKPEHGEETVDRQTTRTHTATLSPVAHKETLSHRRGAGANEKCAFLCVL